LKNSIVF
jgi:hypothetical protein